MVSVNTFHANIIILGSCAKNTAAQMSVWFFSLSCAMISYYSVSKLPICGEGKQINPGGADVGSPSSHQMLLLVQSRDLDWGLGQG